MIYTIAHFFRQSVIQGIPLLYGSTGEIITEKSGNLNLGIPGIMYMGGISGIIGAFFYEMYGNTENSFLCVLVPLITSLLGSALMGLIYSFLTITLRANQNVTGLALTTFGIGVGNFFGGSLPKLMGQQSGTISLITTGNYFKRTLPYVDKCIDSLIDKITQANMEKTGEILIEIIESLEEAFLSYGFLAYLAIIIAVIASLVLSKARAGLNLRAVGESPATADAAGISVTTYKYVATITGSAIAGLGGLYFVMDYTGGAWTNGGFGDRGWLAIALVIFATWKPHWAILGSILFGGLYILPVQLSGLTAATTEIIKALPYAVTIVVLILISVRKKRENQPPESLGLPYFREER